jgi:ribosomal protein S12 methylthiotransferase
MEFISRVRFDRLGVFSYSEEEETWSALQYPDTISQEIKEERMGALMEVQEKISLENNLKRVGHTLKILIDRKEGENYIGRTEYDSPVVDNEVILGSEQPLKTGDFYNARIYDADSFDLFGNTIE